jgi:nitroreductase
VGHGPSVDEELIMSAIDTIMERKSIRAFKPDPVPRTIIEEMLRLAAQAPSAINLQPWEFTVVTGEERERLSRRLIKAYREKRISCGPGSAKPLPKTVAKRGAKTLAAMKPFFEEMGISSDRFINEGSCHFYEAPAAILICMDDAFSRAALVDIGVALGYLLLAIHDRGLGSCPIGLITAYEDEIKDLLNIPGNKRLIVGIALGYPDSESPINRFKSTRDPMENLVRWIE